MSTKLATILPILVFLVRFRFNLRVHAPSVSALLATAPEEVSVSIGGDTPAPTLGTKHSQIMGGHSSPLKNQAIRTATENQIGDLGLKGDSDEVRQNECGPKTGNPLKADRAVNAGGQ